MTFSKDEYARRIAATRSRMQAAGIDLLVEAEPANMHWLTGYDGWSFYVPQAVLLALEGPAVWLGRGIDRGGALLTCHMAPEDMVAYPETLIQNPPRHPMEFAGQEITRRGWGKARIGIWEDSFYFSPLARRALRASLPNASFAPADLLVNWARLVKSDAEIAVIRQAGKITESVMNTYFATIRPGIRQCDVAGEVLKAQASGTVAFGGDYSASIPFMPIGIQTSASHLTWTSQKVQADQTTYLECSGVRLRYHSPLARTVHLGKPPQKLLDVNTAVLDGMEAALAEVKPGNTCEQVEAAWRAALARHGLKKESRIGYPIGVGYPPTWGERTASLRAGDKTVLQPNMCFHMILGMWMGDWGFETSESFRVSDQGAECFSNVPRGLRVID